MTTVILNLCASCKRRTGNTTCLSFPEGIPQDILWGEADHREPRDHEPVYDPDPAKADWFDMWLRMQMVAGLTAAGADDQFYRRSQPRDRRGRWTDGPGGGLDLTDPNALDVPATEARLLAGQQAECDRDELDPLLRDMAGKPTTNLARLAVNGEKNMYTHHVRDIPRELMPQLPQNVEQLGAFKKALGDTTFEIRQVDPRDLHMTQSQLRSDKVGKIYSSIMDQGWDDDSLLFCSRNGDILDGHHRWAAAAAARASGRDVKVTVCQVDLPIDELLKVAGTVSLGAKGMTGAAWRGRISFDADQPTSPPPNAYEPWFWADGKWWKVVTDTGDEVEEALFFPEEEDEGLQASAGEAFKYNPSQPRIPAGRPGGGRFAKGHFLAASGRYDDLTDKGKAAVDAAMRERGLTRQALKDEILDKVAPGGQPDKELLRSGERWYPDAKKFNEDMAAKHGLTLEQATAMTAALSPRLGWEENKRRVGIVAERLKEFPADMDPAQVAAQIGGSIPQFLTDTVEASRAADMDAISAAVGGTKRRSFYNNMLSPGGTDDVTVDVWTMLVGLNARRDGTQTVEMTKVDPDVMAWLKQNETSTKGGAGYVSISDAFRDVAAELGTTPDAVQAAYWEKVRGKRD